MSHLVVDSKEREIKKTDSESEILEEQEQASKYINQIVHSDSKIDRELILLHRALNTKEKILSKGTVRYNLDLS